MRSSQIFLSYASEDAFEAELLKMALESQFKSLGVSVWAYHLDQTRSERVIWDSVKQKIEESAALIILVSPYTIANGATPWTEFATADAFGIPSYVLLHHLTYAKLVKSKPSPPVSIREGHCTASADWRSLLRGLENDLVPQKRGMKKAVRRRRKQ